MSAKLSGCGGGSGGSSGTLGVTPPSYLDASAQLPTVSALVAAAGDLDGDTDTDIVIAGSGAPRLLRNELSSSGGFLDAGLPPIDMSTFGVAIADIDGDGKLDIVLANDVRSRSVTLTAAGSGGGKDIEIASSATTIPQLQLPNMVSRRGPGVRSEGLLAFPASIFTEWNSIPKCASVTGAHLELFERSLNSNVTIPASTIALHQNLRSFDDLLTTWDDWHGPNAATPTASVPSASLSLPSRKLTIPGVYRSITVTALVQSWVASATLRDNGITVSGTASLSRILLASDDLGNPPNPSFPLNPPRLVFEYIGPDKVILMNKGGGVFVDESGQRLPQPTQLGSSRGVAIADLDGVNGPDLIFVNDGAPPELFLNDGTGHFIDASARFPARASADRAVALLDVNRDGALDVFIVALNQPAALFVRDPLASLLSGGTAFTDEAAARLPPAHDPDATSAAAGDATRDGLDDILITKAGPPFALLWESDRSGHFRDVSSTIMGNATATEATQPLLADLNGDGRLDMLIPDPLGAPVVLMGLGRGVFSDISFVLPTATAGATAAVAADFNRDGKGDLFLSGPGGTRALLLGK